MLSLLVAQLVILLHLAFIIFVVFGALLVLRWPRLAWLHLPAVIWAALSEFFGWICPLTPWENRLRRIAGESGYSGGFIEEYLLPIIYPAELTRELQIGLGIGVLAMNLLLYGSGYLRRRH